MEQQGFEEKLRTTVDEEDEEEDEEAEEEEEAVSEDGSGLEDG